LCKITSKGPCSERGRDSSIDTKLIPFFLTKHMTRNSSRSTKEKTKAWQEPQYSIQHAELVIAVSIYHQSTQNIHITCPQFIISNMLEQRDNTQTRNINGMVLGYIYRGKERNVIL